MNKQRELKPAKDDCVFSGVPLHEMQRVRELVSGNWRAVRTARLAFLQNAVLAQTGKDRLDS